MHPKPSKRQLEKIEQLQKMDDHTRAKTSEVQLEIIRQQLDEYRRALASRERASGNRPDFQSLLLEAEIKALEGILADNEPLLRMYALIRDTESDINRHLEVAKSTGDFPDEYYTKTLPQIRHVYKVRSEVDLHYLSLYGKELVYNWSRASWPRRGLLVQRFMTLAPRSCMDMVSCRLKHASFGFRLWRLRLWGRRL